MGLKIAITVGHSILKNGSCTSAGGYIQEHSYCKELAPLLANYLRSEGNTVDVIVCPERQFIKPYQEKGYKLGKINGKKYDLVIELHLNAFNGSAKGTEVLYSSERGKSYAQRVNDKLDDVFVDRNIKQRKDLYILRDSDCPSILVEAFFCDNIEDYGHADELSEKKLIARKIAEGILNKSILEVEENVITNFKNGGYSGRKAKVTGSSLNVRYNRGIGYRVINKLKKGDIVDLGYCLNGWVGIKGHDGNKGFGYVSIDYLELI